MNPEYTFVGSKSHKGCSFQIIIAVPNCLLNLQNVSHSSLLRTHHVRTSHRSHQVKQDNVTESRVQPFVAYSKSGTVQVCIIICSNKCNIKNSLIAQVSVIYC